MGAILLFPCYIKAEVIFWLTFSVFKWKERCQRNEIKSTTGHSSGLFIKANQHFFFFFFTFIIFIYIAYFLFFVDNCGVSLSAKKCWFECCRAHMGKSQLAQRWTLIRAERCCLVVGQNQHLRAAAGYLSYGYVSATLPFWLQIERSVFLELSSLFCSHALLLASVNLSKRVIVNAPFEVKARGVRV